MSRIRVSTLLRYTSVSEVDLKAVFKLTGELNPNQSIYLGRYNNGMEAEAMTDLEIDEEIEKLKKIKLNRSLLRDIHEKIGELNEMGYYYELKLKK
jgi:MinD superfamily P-loop ATPase